MPFTTIARFARMVPAALLLAAAPLPVAAEGVFGSYLAAEHAARLGDVVAAAKRYERALAQDPKNLTLMERALTHRLASGGIEPATALARQLVEAGGEQIRSHIAALTLATAALRKGDGAAALTALDGEEADRGGFVAVLMRPWARAVSGDIEGAREMLVSLEEGGVGGPAGRYLAAYHQGLLAGLEGDDAAAVAAFERARSEAGSTTRRLVNAQARSLARLARTDEARALLDGFEGARYSNPAISRLSADIAAGDVPDPLVTTAQHGAAEALYGLARYMMSGDNRLVGFGYLRLATHLRPGFIDAHLLLAEQFVETERFALAVRAYDAVPESAPEALEARIGRAAALDGEGKAEEAIQALRAVVARWPNEIEAHRALGDLLRQSERFEEAAEAYDGAIALIDAAENRHWPLYFRRGIALERSKQWPRAEADFRKALELEPDQPLVLNYLGYSWVEMGMNLDEARTMIETAVENRPGDGYIVDSLGWVLYRLGDFDGAVEHLGRAVELKPVDPVINDHFGDALWMVGRKTEARFQWHRALSFDPEADVEARILKKLEVGLDEVLAEEAAAGKPAIIGRTEEAPEPASANDGG
ncbi:MAG: tetratricopeptide repeat protein [Pikeienuella sp.]